MLDELIKIIVKNLEDWFLEINLDDTIIDLNSREKENNKNGTIVNISVVNMSYEAFGLQRNHPNSTSLNIKILFSTENKKDYLKELQVLSSIVQFFNDHPTFDQENSLQEKSLNNINFRILETKESELPLLFLSKKKAFTSSVIYECRLATFQEGNANSGSRNTLAGW